MKKVKEFTKRYGKCSVLYDAGSISCRLGLSPRKGKVDVTFPPLPLVFQGTFDLMPFLVYENIAVDEGSRDYFFEEPAIGADAKTLLGTLRKENKITVIDYASELSAEKEKIRTMSDEVYDEVKSEAKNKKEDSLYYDSKEKWLGFIKNLDAQPRKSNLLKDTPKTVKDNLKRIETDKWIPRDYIFLKENLIDVCSVYTLSRKLVLPVHAWDDWGCYHRHIMEKYDEERRWTGENKVELARSLWRLYLPDIRLEEIGIDEFIRLLEHPGVKSLQRFIQKSRFNPEEIDHEFYMETQREVSEMYKRADRYRVIFSIGWTAASVLASTVWPPAGLSGIAFEIAMQIAISKTLHTLEKTRFPWKVALEDIRVSLKKHDVEELQKEVRRRNSFD